MKIYWFSGANIQAKMNFLENFYARIKNILGISNTVKNYCFWWITHFILYFITVCETTFEISLDGSNRFERHYTFLVSCNEPFKLAGIYYYGINLCIQLTNRLELNTLIFMYVKNITVLVLYFVHI